MMPSQVSSGKWQGAWGDGKGKRWMVIGVLGGLCLALAASCRMRFPSERMGISFVVQQPGLDPVPEPTSGMLLMLGVGLMALKRKRA